MRKAIFTLVLLLFWSRPTPAWAERIRIYYDPTYAPASIGSLADAVATIHTAMREWELASAGSLVFEYGGEVTYTGNPYQWTDRPNILVRWDPNIPIGYCGRTCGWGWGGCNSSGDGGTFQGHVKMNPVLITAAVGPSTTSHCAEFLSNLMHEMAHVLRSEHSHPDRSVLAMDVPTVGYRHVWEEDVAALLNNSLPQRDRGIRMEQVLSDNSLGILSEFNVAWTATSPPALSVGDGQALSGSGMATYAVAYGDTNSSPTLTRGMRFLRTDGVNREDHYIVVNPATTTSRVPCIANSASGNDYVVVWASTTQENRWYPLTSDVRGGARTLWAIESHNRGVSWSTPEQVPYALTRTGSRARWTPRAGRSSSRMKDPTKSQSGSATGRSACPVLGNGPSRTAPRPSATRTRSCPRTTRRGFNSTSLRGAPMVA